MAGVCAGLAYYFGLPTRLVRFLMKVLFCCGVGIILYIILWRKMPLRKNKHGIPEVPTDFYGVTGDSRVLQSCGDMRLEKRPRGFSGDE